MFNIKSLLTKISGYMLLSEQESGSDLTINNPQNSIFESGQLLGVRDDLVLNNNDIPNPTDKEAELQAKRDFIQQKLEETGHKRSFSCESMDTLLELDMKDLKRASELFYIDGREDQFTGFEIQKLLELSDEELEKAKTLFKAENRKEEFRWFDIIDLVTLSEKEYAKAKTLFNVEDREKQLSGWEIAQLVKLTDEQLERARTLFNIENRKEQFDISGIAELSTLSDDEFRRAQALFNINGREKQFDWLDILMLVYLSDEELEYARDNLFVIEGRKEQLEGTDIAKLSSLNNAERKIVSKYIESNMSAYCLSHIFDYNKDLLDFVDLHYKEISDSWVNRNGRMHLKYGNKEFLFNKTGLTGTIEDLDDTDKITERKCRVITYNNLNIKETAILGKTKNAPEFFEKIFEETLTYYDEIGNITKTVNFKSNPDNGVLNVSETDKNGKQIPIQWQSIDPNSGAKITERHLTSPDGVKTDYYAEENDNLKITDYKITDKDGNALINVHQTFEQIDENKYISSINTTGKHKDTQIYKIEYTDNVAKVYDKQNKKEVSIDLEEYFKDDTSLKKILPMIKQMPGHILLELAENPLTFNYKFKGEAQAWTDIGDEIEIRFDNYENIKNAQESLLSDLTHELGHYIDEYRHANNGIISSNPEVICIFKDELEKFENSTTVDQQSYLSYFINGCGYGEQRGHEEKVAETHSILYSTDSPLHNIRRFYLAQYFPRTIAAIMKLLLEEEGVNVPKD